MPRFDFPKTALGGNFMPDERGRFYKVAFQNHDGNIVGMFTIQDEKRADILSVDSAGGLKILNVDALSSEVLELFENDPVVVTAVALNQTTNVIYMGMKSGAIWGSNLESSEEINYRHDGQVTAIAAFKSVIISVGADNNIKMFHVPKGQVVATVHCSNEIGLLKMLPSIRGGPVAIADVLGNVSVWSPHRLSGKGVENSIQSVCNMNGRPVSLDTVQMFERTCLLCVTGAWIRIWAVSIIEDGAEVISILRDPIYSLVRSIEAPELTQFTSCCNTSTEAVATLLTGCSDGSVYQWHALSGARLRKYIITPNVNTFLVHIPNRYLFAACDNSNDLNIIDPNSSALIDRTDTIEDITCGALCDFRGVITVVGAAGILHIRNGDTQISSRSARRIDTGAISALSIMALESSENIVIVAGFITGIIHSYIGLVEDDFVFDHFAMKELRIYKSRVTVIRSFGNEDLVATSSELESTIIWKASDKGLVKLIELANTIYTTCITSSPLGFIAIGTEDGTLALYNCKTWKPIATKTNAHQEEGIRSIGIFFDPVKNSRNLVSVGKRCRSVKTWKQQGASLVFENRIDLPSNCSDVLFWEKGESSLMFIQTNSKFSYCMDMMNPQRGPLRYFSVNGGQLLSVSGNSSPVVLTLGFGEDGTRGNVVNIWNNDLHDEQVAHNNMLNEFNALSLDPTGPKTTLYAAVKSHPSYPGCLLDTDPHHGDQTLLARAVMCKLSDFLATFLPQVPVVVLQKFLFRGQYRTLLWMAVKMKDTSSIDCILRVWNDILTSPPSSIEESAWHASDLFEDLKMLSRENPAKFADFIQHLSIPMNHSITYQGCDSKDIIGEEIWMRGSALRVIPQFWAQVSTAFPDLQGRLFEPDKESSVSCVEMPHEDPNLREPFTKTFEPGQIKTHPSVNGDLQGKLVIEESEWDMTGVEGKLGSQNSFALKKRFLSSGGSVVQSYIHPIPYAAAGVEFLQICQSCCSSSGRQTLMASPAVSTVIEYKWKTFFGDMHVGAAMHYMYVLILYSVCVVYFDAMIDAPIKTGLPILAWIGFIFVGVSYVFLLIQEFLQLPREGLSAFDSWFGVGIVGYCLAVSGITMTLVEGETSFNSRCVLAIACLFLYLKFLNFLLPFTEFGQLVHRFLFTLNVIKYNIAMVILGLFGFAVSFNLMHHRHSEFTTYDSLYGSFLQTMSYAFGGFTTEFADESDNSIFMSFVFVAFVFILLLVLIVILIASAVDAYRTTINSARCAWRASQTKFILRKASLLSATAAGQTFHNPKWLHMLAPAGRVQAFLNYSDEENRSCSCCDQGSGAEACGNKPVLEEIESLRSIVLQLQDRVDGLQLPAGSAVNEADLARTIANLLREDLLKAVVKPVVPIAEPERPIEAVKKLSPRQPPVESTAKAPPIEERKPSIALDPVKVKGNASSHIRVRQIKASKKKLSRMISDSDDEGGSSPNGSPQRF